MHGGKRERILVHLPCGVVRPSVKPVARREIIYVIYIEILRFFGIFSEKSVQLVYRSDTPVNVRAIPVSKQPKRRKLEIVLNYRAAEFLAYALPSLPEMRKFAVDYRSDSFRTVGNFGETHDIAVCGVEINEVGRKSAEFFGRKHCVLPELGVFRKVKLRLNAVIQQK